MSYMRPGHVSQYFKRITGEYVYSPADDKIEWMGLMRNIDIEDMIVICANMFIDQDKKWEFIKEKSKEWGVEDRLRDKPLEGDELHKLDNNRHKQFIEKRKKIDKLYKEIEKLDKEDDNVE